MPPIPTWFRGRDAVAAFLAGWPLALARELAHAARAGERPARVRRLQPQSRARCLHAHVIEVVTLRGDRISEIISFMSPERFAAFGLPPELGE